MNGEKYIENKSNENIKKIINNIIKENQREIVIKYNTYLAAQGIMTKTRENYTCKIKMFLNKVNKDLNEVTFDDYVSYMSQNLDKSSSYQIQIYTALKSFADYLCIAGITEKNNIEGVKRPKARESIKTKEKREHNYLNQNELEKFLLNVKMGTSKYERKVDNSIRDNFLFQLMLNTGLRKSAVIKLDLSNIDMENKVLRVVEKRGKVRTCYLSEPLLELLNEWLDIRQKEYNPIDDALFITRKGTRITERGMDKLVAKYGEGIKDIKLTPHKLRATYGTMIYEKTGDIYLTQQCMGHSNVQTTMLYVRGQEEKAQKKAAEIMSSLTF